MDEPFSALDAQTREIMQTELLRIWEQGRKTVLFVTHQIDEAVFLSDRVLVFARRPGRLQEIVDIELPRPRALAIKRTPEFVALCRPHLAADRGRRARQRDRGEGVTIDRLHRRRPVMLDTAARSRGARTAMCTIRNPRPRGTAPMSRNRITRRQFTTTALARRRRAGDAQLGARAAELSDPSSPLHPAVRCRRRRRYHRADCRRKAWRQAGPALCRGKSAGTGRHRGGARRALAAGRRLHHRSRHQRHLDQRRDLQPAAVRPGEGFRLHFDHRLFRAGVLHQRGIPQFKTLQDFIKAARANPGKLNVGTINVGGTQNLAAELFKSSAGINFQIIPYRNTPEVIVAALRNDVQLMVDFYAPLKGSLVRQQASAVGALPARSARRSCRTCRRSPRPVAFPYEVTSWNGVFAPRRHAGAVLDLLNKAIHEVVAMPGRARSATLELGIEAKASTPEELKARLEGDIKKWAAVIRRLPAFPSNRTGRTPEQRR